MRGSDERSESLFSYVDLESRVRAGHPLRTVREIANAALTDLFGEFAQLYEVSQRCRKRIEEVFGWIKSSAGLAKVKLRGRSRVDAAFTMALAAYNLIRLPKLLSVPA